MSSSYQSQEDTTPEELSTSSTSPPFSSHKRKRNKEADSGDESPSGDTEDLSEMVTTETDVDGKATEPPTKTKKIDDIVSKAVVSQPPPKPFGFTSVMNMMPSF